MSDIIYAAGATAIPEEVIALAKRLEAIHGIVSIHRESNGIHLHIPDPELLKTDGRKEFDSRHCSINAEKYLGIGRYDVDTHPTPENRQMWEMYRSRGREVGAATCHKDDRTYPVSYLLSMTPVEKRGIDFGKIKRHVSIGADGSRNMVDDGTGTMVPNWCGDTVELTKLPLDHPAIMYLVQRGYNPYQESYRYGLCYCTKAAPEDPSKGVYYSRVGRLKNTPEGRIILPIWINGHRLGYQSRLIDAVDNNGPWVWQNNRWNRVSDDEKKKFHKYMNAQGSAKNTLLFGYDQAVRWNEENGKSICIISEGPLDAVRLGPPALAMLGSSMSPTQAKLIVDKFKKVIIIGDNDAPGRRAVQKMYGALSDAGLNPSCIDELIVPAGKDVGGMTYEAAQELLNKSNIWKNG